MKSYSTPMAEKIEFSYEENITASNSGPHHGDVGHGVGLGGGCDHDPGHGNPHTPHPVFPGGKP